MIEVIKHGQKKFKATCAHCGCEFTYELEDVKMGQTNCPDCGQYVVHQSGNTNNDGLYYPPNCRGIEYAPKTMYFSTTDSNKAGTIDNKLQEYMNEVSLK